MSYQIQIEGTHYRFEHHGGESLLEAALNAGVPVNYGCSNGNCGDCAASLIRGEIHQLRHSDHHFCEAARASGKFLMCTHAAQSDLVLKASTAQDSTEIPRQDIQVKVRKIDRLNDDIAVLDVQTPRTQRLRFLAGQWVSLQTADGSRCELPIASCPCDDRNLQFHVPVAGDYCRTAGALLKATRGSSLELVGPSGSFVLDHASERPRVMLGSGFGFPPLKSIIEHSLALQPDVRIDLVWLEPPEEKHYMENHMRMWNDALDNFHLHRVDCVALAGDSPSEETIGLIRSLVDEASDIYIAGPRELDRLQSWLESDLGIPADHIHRCIV